MVSVRSPNPDVGVAADFDARFVRSIGGEVADAGTTAETVTDDGDRV